jgi:hypothetical protein
VQRRRRPQLTAAAGFAPGDAVTLCLGPHCSRGSFHLNITALSPLPAPEPQRSCVTGCRAIGACFRHRTPVQHTAATHDAFSSTIEPRAFCSLQGQQVRSRLIRAGRCRRCCVCGLPLRAQFAGCCCMQCASPPHLHSQLPGHHHTPAPASLPSRDALSLPALTDCRALRQPACSRSLRSRRSGRSRLPQAVATDNEVCS